MLSKKKFIKKIKNNQLKSIFLFIILIFIIWGFYLLFTEKKKEDIVQNLKEDNYITEKKICFYKDLENGFDYMEIDFLKKPKIFGYLNNFRKNSSDGLSGDFNGAALGPFVNIVANLKDGLKEWKEQKLYMILDDRLIIANYIKKEFDENGVLAITKEDVLKATFNQEYYLPKVDCSLIDQEKVKIK